VDNHSDEKSLERPPDMNFGEGSRAINMSMAELPHKRRDGYISVYSDNVGFAINPWDIRMLFGHVDVTEDAQTGFVNDQCSVTMCWEHALALSEALKRAIAEYERTQGPIRRTAIQHLISPKEQTGTR